MLSDDMKPSPSKNVRWLECGSLKTGLVSISRQLISLVSDKYSHSSPSDFPSQNHPIVWKFTLKQSKDLPCKPFSWQTRSCTTICTRLALPPLSYPPLAKLSLQPTLFQPQYQEVCNQHELCRASKAGWRIGRPCARIIDASYLQPTYRAHLIVSRKEERLVYINERYVAD